MASLTFSLGAIPLNGLYRSMGRLYYWLFWLAVAGALFSLGFPAMAIGMSTLTLLVGIFNEVRRHGYTNLTAGFISVSFSSTLSFVGAFFWAKWNQIKWYPFFEKYISENVLKYLPQTEGGSFNFDVKQIIVQIPSAVVIVFILSLFLTIIFEKKLLTWLKSPVLYKETLQAFRLPDSSIWIFISSLLMAFIKSDALWVNAVGLNLLNIISLMYFFQGLAVISFYLRMTKATPFWSSLIYILAILQLFIAVVFLGVMDYWFDFRRKMIKKAAEIKTHK
ncbi:MAG: DUF2232 domain-containing protein [Bdellovibrionaceae bacterium]|nr:DUF2232 domain-containing protein [Pseudobdellovibrionaceae bacterium]